MPLASLQAETLERFLWSKWAFTGMPVPQALKVHVGLGGPFRSLICGPANAARGINLGLSAVSSAQSPNFPGIPLGPFEVVAHAPFPACLAFQNALGFPTFSHSTRTLVPVASAGSFQAFSDTGHSLQFLHLDPSLSLPPFPTSFPNSSVASWHPFPTAVPVHCPQGFELPGAQGYCQRHGGPASRMAAHALWGFFRWSLIPASPQPTPQPKCPGETHQRGQCTPNTYEGGSIKPSKEAWTFWTERCPDLCQQWDMERVYAFLKKWRAERRRRRQSGGRIRQRRMKASDKEGSSPVHSPALPQHNPHPHS